MTSLVKEIAEADFQTEVIERSKELPVVVDFWAPWCGPCRTLAPLLEAAVNAQQGRVIMVKVNTDASPTLAAAYNIQGIPAVKAFRDGVQVDEFVGALPAPAIAQFIARLTPSPGLEALNSALAALSARDRATAEQRLRSLVADDEVGSSAAFHLAHVLVTSGGAVSEVRDLADKVHPSSPLYPRVEALLGLAEFLDRAHGQGADQAAAAVAANGKDHEAWLALASTHLSRGHVTDALDALLESVSRSPNHASGAAKKAMLAIFDHLEQPGAEAEIARAYRRKLQIVS